MLPFVPVILTCPLRVLRTAYMTLYTNTNKTLDINMITDIDACASYRELNTESRQGSAKELEQIVSVSASHELCTFCFTQLAVVQSIQCMYCVLCLI